MKWIGFKPNNCDLCKSDISNRFYDARVRVPEREIWATCCPACHKKYGIGMGTGKGHEFVKQSDGSFEKVEA